MSDPPQEGAGTPREEGRSLTVAEAATVMRVSKLAVHRMVRSGALPAIRTGRSQRIPRQAVHDYLTGTAAKLGSFG
ncbi:helix-turn-helix domain-containing protein [Nocardiopsis sp. LOL_012]|uniref:helix-turn-helix domain-containing protein n=1 Tax=Nocardiopsis sp. LOL_012 TaxID=3345409 RepID=UPI003A83CC3F